MLQFNFKLLSVSADKAFHTFSGLLKAGREHPCHRIGFLRPGKQQRGKKYEPVYVHKNCSSICDITLQGLSFPAVCPCSLQHFSLCLTLEKCSGRIGTKYKGWQQGLAMGCYLGKLTCCQGFLQLLLLLCFVHNHMESRFFS